jgi:hypothetical protein
MPPISSFRSVALSRMAWLSAGALVGRLLPFAVLLWCNSRLPLVEYNTLSMAFMFVSVVSIVLTSGVNTVLLQRMAGADQASQQWGVVRRFRRFLVPAQGVAALAVLLVGERVFHAVFGTTLRSEVAWPLALAVLAWPHVLFVAAALNGSHRVSLAAGLTAAGGVLQGGSMLLAMVRFPADGVAMAWGLAFGSACATVLGLLALHFAIARHPVNQGSGAEAKPVSPQRSDAGSLAIATVAASSVMPVSFLCSAMLARGAGGAGELAAYYTLEQATQLLLFLPAMAGQALTPMVAQRFAHADRALQQHMMRRWKQLIVTTLLLVLAAGSSLAWVVAPALQTLQIPTLGLDQTWSVRWMLLHALLALPLALLGAIVVGAGGIIAGSVINMVWGALTLLGTWAELSSGNAGFQMSRVAASVLALMLGLLYLHHMGARERRVTNT